MKFEISWRDSILNIKFNPHAYYLLIEHKNNHIYVSKPFIPKEKILLPETQEGFYYKRVRCFPGTHNPDIERYL